MKTNPAATPTSPPPVPALRRILVPCDFSEASRQSLAAAAALAGVVGARLVLLYVLPVTLPPDIAHVSAVLNNDKLVKIAREQLAALVRATVPGEIPVDLRVAEGGPYHEINATARRLGVDLIFIGTHGFSGVKHLLLGSTAERVVRHAPCPVLTWHIPRETAASSGTASHAPVTPAVPFKNILVPVDFSPANAAALRHAAHYAKTFGGRITLLHVVEPPPYPEWGYAHLVRRDQALQKAAREKLDALVANLQRQGCSVNPVLIATGDADTHICRVAGENHPDLLVLATHGHSALAQMFLGGTAERVVRHAPCPVLVVRAQAAATVTRAAKSLRERA